MWIVDALWTLPELVAEVAARISALPAPKNGQVRAIPDDRTVRYYVTLGLLDRPSAMRGRTALYGKKHVAQVVAIKRLQTMGRSLSEIQELWPTLDDRTLARMSGVALPETAKPVGRPEFWKRGAVPDEVPDEALGGPAAGPSAGRDAALDADNRVAAELAGPPGGAASGVRASVAPPARAAGAVELRIELAPHVVLSLSVANGGAGRDDRDDRDDSVVISPADVRAIRAAAAPLLAELASRRLAPHPGGEEP
jgi:DNA-binding transcriptional MerR regulator